MMRRASRLIAMLLSAILLTLSLGGCAAGTAESGAEIVCTIYPIYDWVSVVLGDRVSDYPVRLLSENGNDPHNYQPTVRDLIEVSGAALFICAGGVSDAWAEEAARPQGETLVLLDAVELCAAEHDHEEGEHGHDHSEIDEHFWLSLSNAKRAVTAIMEALSALYAEDEAAVADFRANAAAYIEGLDALDSRYRAAVAEAERDTILVADRFPFVYLTEAYGIKHLAAFPGCSAETEASFSTVLSLVDAVKALEPSVILITETGDRALSDTVIRAAGKEDVEVLTLHSCQSVTLSEREAGVSYLSIMEENLSVLIRALAA